MASTATAATAPNSGCACDQHAGLTFGVAGGRQPAAIVPAADEACASPGLLAAGDAVPFLAKSTTPARRAAGLVALVAAGAALGDGTAAGGRFGDGVVAGSMSLRTPARSRADRGSAPARGETEAGSLHARDDTSFRPPAQCRNPQMSAYPTRPLLVDGRRPRVDAGGRGRSGSRALQARLRRADPPPDVPSSCQLLTSPSTPRSATLHCYAGFFLRNGRRCVARPACRRSRRSGRMPASAAGAAFE